MQLTEDDRRTIAAILRTHAEIQDRHAMDGTVVLARLIQAEPDNPLTLAMKRDLQEIEEDSTNLCRLAALMEQDLVP